MRFNLDGVVSRPHPQPINPKFSNFSYIVTSNNNLKLAAYQDLCACAPASLTMTEESGFNFELSGIQKVTTVDAATNMALRGAHFKHAATPMWLFQNATCQTTWQYFQIFNYGNCENSKKISVVTGEMRLGGNISV